MTSAKSGGRRSAGGDASARCLVPRCSGTLERQAWILGELTREEVDHLAGVLRRLGDRVSRLNSEWRNASGQGAAGSSKEMTALHGRFLLISS